MQKVWKWNRHFFYYNNLSLFDDDDDNNIDFSQIIHMQKILKPQIFVWKF